MNHDLEPESDVQIAEYKTQADTPEELIQLVPQPKGSDSKNAGVEKTLLGNPEPGMWDCPKAEPLMGQWLHGAMLNTASHDNPAFRVLTSNFVFNGVCLKLWEGGIRRQCCLYQRQEHLEPAEI